MVGITDAGRNTHGSECFCRLHTCEYPTYNKASTHTRYCMSPHVRSCVVLRTYCIYNLKMLGVGTENRHLPGSASFPRCACVSDSAGESICNAECVPSASKKNANGTLSSSSFTFPCFERAWKQYANPQANSEGKWTRNRKGTRTGARVNAIITD